MQSNPLITAALNGNVGCGRSRVHKFYLPCPLARSGCMSCLVESGADVNTRRNEGRTPLMLASSYGYLNAVTFLVEHGANMDLQDKEGNTALHRAARGNAIEVYDKLLALGAVMRTRFKW